MGNHATIYGKSMENMGHLWNMWENMGTSGKMEA